VLSEPNRADVSTTNDDPKPLTFLKTKEKPRPKIPTPSSTATSPAARTIFSTAKALFRRCNIPTRLVGRTAERAAVLAFWETNVLQGLGGSMYVAGIPGTGKTALLDEVVRDMHEKTRMTTPHTVHITKINCMTVKDPEKIYPRLVAEIHGNGARPSANVEKAIAELEELFRPTSDPKATTFHVVILDEIDTLVTKDCKVLYKLFGWASQQSQPSPSQSHQSDPDTPPPPPPPRSRMALIGIGNSLDLTLRVLPRLLERQCNPTLVKFHPYDVKDIMEIIRGRLRCLRDEMEGDGTATTNAIVRRQAERGKENGKGKEEQFLLMHPMAVELCARKMAATGDLRKALDVCRQAIELVELEHQKHLKPSSTTTTLQPHKENSTTTTTQPPSMLATRDPTPVPKVTVKHILAAATRIAAAGLPPVPLRVAKLNLQQKMVVATLCVLATTTNPPSKHTTTTTTTITTTTTNKAPVTLQVLYDTYLAITRKRTQVPPLARSEVADVVTGIEAAGLATSSS
ncbi:P-loop containing nucleoside triphosphate hydrolase protein, partial [Powellomyces hirtus]